MPNITRFNQASVSGDEVVMAARAWIGTPYVHQMARCGVGCDCLGLVRGVAKQLGVMTPRFVARYSRDWNEISGNESLLGGLQDYARLKHPWHDQMAPGDLICFRMSRSSIAKHVAIFAHNEKMIHARERFGVVEVPLSRFWLTRIAAVFSLSRT